MMKQATKPGHRLPKLIGPGAVLTVAPLILLVHALLDGPNAGAGRVSGLAFAIFFGLLGSVAIHEIGHALGSRLAGFRLVLLSVGPFQVRRTSAGLRFGLNDDWRLLAMEVSLPQDDRNLSRRLMFTFAAGPAANLLTLLLIVAAYWMFDLRQYSLVGVTEGDPVLPWYLTILAFQLGAFSLIGTVVNAIPLVDSGILSDGGRIRMLGRGGPEADRMMAALFLAGAVGGGVRPRDWRREWISRATALEDGSPDEASSCTLAYYWALDRGEIDEAEGYLRRAAAAASHVPILARSLAAEAAFFAARFRGDLDTAQQNMTAVGDSWLERDTRLRAEAAILALEGRPAEAGERAAEALSSLQEAGSATAGIAIAEAEWVADILTAARAEGATGRRGSNEDDPNGGPDAETALLV